MEPQTQNVSPSTNYLKFSELPKQIQERLLERQRATGGQAEGFAFKTVGISSAFFFIPAAIIWMAIIFYFADDYLWSDFRAINFGIISLGVFYLLLGNLYKLIQWLTSRSKGYLLITPLYLIETRFNDVWYWDMDQVLSANSVNRFQEGRYLSSQITLSLEQGATKTFDITGLDNAEETVEQVYYYKKLYAEATAKNDTDYFNSKDDFIEVKNQPRQLKAPPGKNLKRLTTSVAALIMTAGTMFGAVSFNKYCDDKKSWDYAESANRAYQYRTYLQTHPQGRWVSNAQQKLQELYEAAIQKYQASLNRGYDQKAADAVLQMLKYAKESQNYHVKIIFERHNEIPQNIVEDLKKEFNVKNILSFGDTFSDEKMGQRESSLSAVVANAFRDVISDDILEFSGECVTFLVNYEVGSKNSIYFDTRQENIPCENRIFSPGIFIDWDFDIRIPNQPQSYNFKLASLPALDLTYDNNNTALDKISPENEEFSKTLEANKNYLYDSMVSSAFADFRANLVYRMGIGVEPVKKDDPDDEDMSNTRKTVPVSKKKGGK